MLQYQQQMQEQTLQQQQQQQRPHRTLHYAAPPMEAIRSDASTTISSEIRQVNPFPINHSLNHISVLWNRFIDNRSSIERIMR